MANAGYGFNTSHVEIRLTCSEDANTMKWRFGTATQKSGTSPSLFSVVATYLEAIAGGAKQGGALLVATGAVNATGTITLSSLANNNTITVNGVVFTAKTTGASGAVQFNLGTSDTTAAANFCTVFNACTTALTRNAATATSSGAVITITSDIAGELGNMQTIAISANGSVSGSGLLTGGSQNTQAFQTRGINYAGLSPAAPSLVTAP